MPKKSKRVAARHAQLSLRKRKDDKGPSGIPIQAAPQPSAEAETASAETPSTATATTVAAAPSSHPSAARRARPRELPPVYQHIKSEVLRIGILTALAAVALVALTFLLR